ncbi:MAG: pentapeptide repeat-containing protein, partial [Methylophilaceae bacterium]|nr:pentapeptide repeat-containing protein [Methylophilaceae bacterium]
KDAKALLDTSAEKNRNLLFGFLLYLVTTTLLVLSITDMDLLLIDKAIPLPLLSIDLPITGFYIFLPLLLLVLHFNVLHNSQEHRIKLKQWVAKLAGASPSTEQLAANLFPFIFDIAIVRYDTNLRNRLVAAAVWLLYVYFPPLVLVLFLVRFADLQELSTLYHLVLLGADILLIHLFWNSVVPASIESGLQPIKKQRQLLARTAKTVVTGMLGFYVLMVFILWGALQGLHYGWISHTSLLIKPVAFMAKSENFEVVLPRISVPDSYPYKVSEDDVRLSVWADEARYRTKHPQDFNYSADKMAAWTNSAPPLNLSGRHLAFADFSQTLLRRVSLDNAKLQGANLSGAQLEDADLDSAQLQGADL